MTENRIGWPNWFTSIVTLFTLFICAPVYASPDAYIHKQTSSGEVRGKKGPSIVEAEKLGKELFIPGTIKKIQDVSLELERRQDLINILIVMQAEHAFAQIEKNVDNYLDWYYSLTGEYMRIYKMLTGEKLDDYIREKLIEHLHEGNRFKGFESALRDAASQNAILVQEYKNTVQGILNRNRINPGKEGLVIVDYRPIEKIINPSVHFDFQALRNRLLSSGPANTLSGSMTDAITNKIIEKVDNKNILKMAAKALAKFVTSKATGSLGGASVGAAAGSAIPVIGTAVGAVVGIVIGGIVIDKGLLKLEEMMNRDAFKGDIMGAINEVKQDLTDTMKPEPPQFFMQN